MNSKCARCGRLYGTVVINRKYCSDACKQKAYRQRRAVRERMWTEEEIVTILGEQFEFYGVDDSLIDMITDRLHDLRDL